MIDLADVKCVYCSIVSSGGTFGKMDSPTNGSYRLPSYRGHLTSRSGPASLHVSPSQLALQKAALLRQGLNSRNSKDHVSVRTKEKDEVSATRTNGSSVKPAREETEPAGKEHLHVYESLPKGLSPREYQAWAQEWLPRLNSRKGARDYAGFAIGHTPGLIKGSTDKEPENISGPLVYHFNPTTSREKKTEYLDLYMEYKTKRAQSAKMPKSKRFTGNTRKPRPDEPKWEFMKPDDERKSVHGAKLEIPAWQANKNTPDTAELNHFLDSVRDKTYISFCQRTAERERERTRTPRNTKSKSAGVKLERLSLQRNKLGILEPPLKVPTRRGNLRQGHSFDLNLHKVNEFQPAPAPDLGQAIVPIKTTKGGDRVFLTEEDPDPVFVEEKPVNMNSRRGVVYKSPVHKLVTRIPTDPGPDDDSSDEVPMETDYSKEEHTPGGFMVSGHRIRKGNTPDDNTSKHHTLGAEEDEHQPVTVQNGGLESENGEVVNDSGVNNTTTKSREIVIRFDQDDKGRIESIKTVSSDRTAAHK